ncbi:MAG: hypothetical protein KatS3mg012_1115 [Gaiellaceae bacterium]|nr:MAG: hypothetical protein KatS3mg012_1115 [Gaiellaceae bacterium]
MAEERPPHERPPTEEELREALAKVDVVHVLAETCAAVVSLGFQRLQSETRDLRQARVAIEALRALEPVLREGEVDAGLLRDLEQARANLQLAYASAVAETPRADAS